jgi:hypothetical protein
VLLVPRPRRRHQSCGFKPAQLPVNCTCPAFDQTDQLRALKTPLRLAKEKPQNALLDRSEERISKSGLLAGTFHSHIGKDHTLFGNDLGTGFSKEQAIGLVAEDFFVELPRP